MKSPLRAILSLALCLISVLSYAQNTIAIDATAPIPAPETGYLQMGGTSSNGHSLHVNSRYLVLDGKPWLPVMGELHYTRIPESEWESEILKMKAAGIDIVATYVFWIHHEEIEGQFDWTGRRDLRRFVELCAKHHMYVWLRPGPWAHGEVRNGGFPDWLNALPNTRTNDPAYLRYVDRFFQQIGMQLHGLMFKDGGPILGAQLENEYSLHGPGRGAEHILKLKQIAIADGIDPPLFSVTGWPSLDFPPRDVIPVSGGYPDGFWYGETTNLPPGIPYLFNFNRELGDMGATVPSEDPTGKVNLKHDPYFAAEEAGGMATAYHRRPVLAPDDIAALTLTGIGSGINLYGYYMFHGGVNPTGHRTTLQESQATGFPNDLPQLDYDFQAPLGAFGQEREVYRRTRLLHLFLNAYGSDLAPMQAFAPAVYSRDPASTEAPRVAVRSDGKAGFVFVNNYVRQLPMWARHGFQVQVKLASGSLSIPARPIDVPANTYFAWPFQLPLGTAQLRYSTAQLLTRLDVAGERKVVFFAVPGIAPEFVFDAAGIRTVHAAHASIARTATTVTVSRLTPGLDCTIELTDTAGHHTTLILLSRDQAEKATLLHGDKQDRLALSDSSILFEGTQLRLRSTASPIQQVALLPGTPAPGATRLGPWMQYTLRQPRKNLNLTVIATESAAPREKMDLGPYVDWRKGSVPTVPPYAAFEHAASWQIEWQKPDLTGLSEALLDLDYTGDIGRLYSSNTLLDDNFYNGLPWQIGLKRFEKEATAGAFTLKLLPMPAVAPIYLDTAAKTKLQREGTAPQLIHARLIPEYESVMPWP